MMQFIDAAPISGTRRTADGYLVADVRTARTGIQEYAGHEVGKAAMDRVRVYRPDTQVFAQDSMASYAHKPVTNDHPVETVTADNWKKLAVGQIGDEVARDGDYVRVPMIVMDKSVIDQIEGGKRELSAGYVCDLKWESGTTPQGEAYDAIQQDIRINHVAVVQCGRAGSQARIGDGAFSWGARPSNHTADTKEGLMADSLRKVMVDGLQVETTDAGAAAIDKLTNDKAALDKRINDAEKALADAKTEHEKTVAAKDAEIDDLKGKVLDAKALDAKVQARADLIAKAKTIANDVKTEGLTDADIRKAAVVAKLGDEAIKDKGEAYIDARFDILAEDAAKTNDADPFRDTLKGGIKNADNDLWGDSVFSAAGVSMKKGA